MASLVLAGLATSCASDLPSRTATTSKCPAEIAKLLNPIDGFALEQWSSSVAARGDLAVVGSISSPAPGAVSGAAYVFARDPGTGAWTFSAKLTASDPDPNDRFGTSVSVMNDRIAVGAPGDDEFATNAGAVYVFRHSMGSWIQEAKLLPTVTSSGLLGSAVSLHDDTVVATEVGRTLSDPGSVYFYRRGGNAWTLEQHSSFSSGQAQQFPDAVAIHEGTCMVGARQALPGSAGVVYVFHRSGTTWIETQVITAPAGLPGDEFGTSVALEGTRAVVGAARYDVSPNFQQGTAYTFRVRQNGQWAFEQQLFPSDPVGSGLFGRSVALSGVRILVGASGAHVGGSATGAAYQFNRQAGSWTEVAKYAASDAEADSDYGGHVALGANAFVAARWDDNPFGFDGGSTYVYTFCP